MRSIDKQLFIEISKGNLSGVKAAIDAGADVNAVCDVADWDIGPAWSTFKGYKVIHFAAAKGTPEIINYILTIVSDPNMLTITTRNTALHIAVWRGKLENLKALLQDERLNLNIRNGWGGTALHEAVKFNHFKIVEKLIEYRADPTITDNNNYSPSDLAIKLSNIKVAQFLLNKRIRRSPFKNKLLLNLDVSHSNHVVAIMRLLNSKNEEHAFLIIETLRSIKRVDLFMDQTREGYSIIVPKDYVVDRMEEKDVMRVLVKALNFNTSESWVYLAWNITSQQLEQLLKDIDNDIKDPPRYHVSGDKAAVAISADGFKSRKTHNCFTWAREKLCNLEVSEILVPLKPTLVDYIAAKTSFYLQQQPTFWCQKQEVIIPSAVCGLIGVGVGFALKSKL